MKKKEKRKKRREAFPPSFNPSTRGRDNWFRSVGKFSLRHLNFQLTKRSGAYSKRKFLIASPLSLLLWNQFASSSRKLFTDASSAILHRSIKFQSILFVQSIRGLTLIGSSRAPYLYSRGMFRNFLASPPFQPPPIQSYLVLDLFLRNLLSQLFYFFLWLPPRGERGS